MVPAAISVAHLPPERLSYLNTLRRYLEKVKAEYQCNSSDRIHAYSDSRIL